MKITTLTTRYVVLMTKCMPFFVFIILAGCVIVVESEATPTAMHQYVNVTQKEAEGENGNGVITQEDKAPLSPPVTIEREISVPCNIPEFPTSASQPELEDVDPDVLKGPGDTEDLLVDYILVLRAFIEERETTFLNHHSDIVDACQ